MNKVVRPEKICAVCKKKRELTAKAVGTKATARAALKRVENCMVVVERRMLYG